MVHQTFVCWALYIPYNFVNSPIRHLGPTTRNVPTCPTFFTYTGMVETMAVEVMATQWDKVSAAMLLTYLSQNIQVALNAIFTNMD